MGAIQGEINSLLSTAAVAAGGVKHLKQESDKIKQEDAKMKKQEAEEIAAAENKMTEAALTQAGYSAKTAKQFITAENMGLKFPRDAGQDPRYVARYDHMKQIKADEVLKSETYAKMLTDVNVRQRIIEAESGVLNKTMSSFLDKEIGKKAADNPDLRRDV